MITIDKKSPVKKPEPTEDGETWPHHCFELHSNGNVEYFKVETQEEMSKWVEKLTEASSSLF